jgi:PqqD family protein of HPr-rel-A system
VSPAFPERPKTREDLTVVVLDGEAVIWNDESGDLHHLNPTATIVFQLCDGTGTPQELTADIAEAFGIAIDEVGPQVIQLIGDFGDAGLLEGVERKLDDDDVEPAAR